MRRLLVPLSAVLLLALSACGSDTSGSSSASTSPSSGSSSGGTTTVGLGGLKVAGGFGQEPKVSVKPAVATTKPVTRVLTRGTGAPVRANQLAMADIAITKGDGTTVYSDAQRGTPSQVTMSQTKLFKPLVDAIVGEPRGTRLVVADGVKALWGPSGSPQLHLTAKDTVVFVVDVLSVQPTKVLQAPQGKKVASPAHAPTVVGSGGTVTGIDFSKAPKNPPKKLTVIPLVKGTGPVAKAGRLVTFNYYGAVYGSKKPFDSSFSRGAPTPFGVGVHALIPAWDKVIPGLRRGSRVLIIAPPSEAYGSKAQSGIPANSTLTFVVDVLGVDS